MTFPVLPVRYILPFAMNSLPPSNSNAPSRDVNLPSWPLPSTTRRPWISSLRSHELGASCRAPCRALPSKATSSQTPSKPGCSAAGAPWSPSGSSGCGVLRPPLGVRTASGTGGGRGRCPLLADGIGALVLAWDAGRAPPPAPAMRIWCHAWSRTSSSCSLARRSCSLARALVCARSAAAVRSTAFMARSAATPTAAATHWLAASEVRSA
mmetsp:Transcript_41572/g.132253  ORF Transcript_41572/g.132253 Transcript_41572/m.132253 type:complete len:210 (-) Transcript_41572:317-946(-)